MSLPITDAHRNFLLSLPMFFVATAAAGARINLSPKGLDSLRVLNAAQVAYLDLTGSGAETAAHLLADGRITLLGCAFWGEPSILRLYGRGTVLPRGGAEYDALAPTFGALAESPGARAIVRIDVEMAKRSCGFTVPVMQLEGTRPILTDWADEMGDDGMATYRKGHNAHSLDGMPTGLVPETAA